MAKNAILIATNVQLRAQFAFFRRGSFFGPCFLCDEAYGALYGHTTAHVVVSWHFLAHKTPLCTILQYIIC